MERWFFILIGMISSILLTSGCNQRETAGAPTEAIPSTGTTPLATETREWRTYRKDEHDFSLSYPPDWIIESESDLSVVLTSSEEKGWQPSTPGDIGRDPRVTIDFGEYIRERLGPAHFPETVDSQILRAWIETRINNEEAANFSERTINKHQAFDVTEIRVPGCERVVYWRPANLKSLIRISTGCESPYLDEFHQIVNSVQQVD